MESPEQRLLSIRNLSVSYSGGSHNVDAVDNVSLDLHSNETLGLVGESGCGKSTLAYAVMGNLGRRGRIVQGEILFRGDNLLRKSRKDLEDIRGKQIAMVPQDPQSALNPSILIGEQIGEVLRRHLKLGKLEARDRTIDLLEQVHMPDPKGVVRRYPHQLSGGMQQRAVICMALACNPDILLMDEPTTGLDVTTEARVLDLISELRKSFDTGILYITHDLGVVARICNRVSVMYAGEIVEMGKVRDLFDQPSHPYTAGLLNCIPRFDSKHNSNQRLIPIKGQVPRLDQRPPGCVFEPRCSYARPKCQEAPPELEVVGPSHRAACYFSDEVARSPIVPDARPHSEDKRPARDGRDSLLSVQNLKKYYGQLYRKYLAVGPLVGDHIKAVDDLSFTINQGETFSLVGESGCGKTTIGRSVIGLVEPDGGEIHLQDMNITGIASKRSGEARQALQIVFQNPYSSLNPRHSILQIVGRPLQLYRKLQGNKLKKKVLELLRAVKLDESYLQRRPAQLSGGEKQRVALARALASDPKLVVCDEITSALDVSVQAAILNLLDDLQQEQGYSYLLVSHNLGVVRHISNRIGVIYLGRLVEKGEADQIFMPPYHPYTEALLSSIPIPDPHIVQKTVRLEGTVPSGIDPPSGCPFHTRCPRKIGPICETDPPPWREAVEGHLIRCHISIDELKEVEPVVQAQYQQ